LKITEAGVTGQGGIFWPAKKTLWVKNGAKRRTRNGGVGGNHGPDLSIIGDFLFFFGVCFNLMDFWLVFVGKTDFQNRCQDGRPFCLRSHFVVRQFFCGHDVGLTSYWMKTHFGADSKECKSVVILIVH